MEMSYEAIVELMLKKGSLSKEEIEKKVNAKVESLSGLISKEGAAHIIAHEMGIEVETPVSPEGNTDLKNLVSGMRNINVIGKITRLFDLKEFNKSDGSTGKVKSGFFNDETGGCRIVFWDDATSLDVNEGDIIKLNNTYVRENRGNLEVSTNDPTLVEINPKDVKLNVKVNSNSSEITKKKISELQENDYNVEIMGTIVQIYDPRFYEVCPVCSKRLKNGNNCPEHGEVEPKFNYVMNIVLDDNTENIRIVLFNEVVESLTNLNRDGVLSYKDNSNFSLVKDSLLGNIVKVIGRVTKNQMFDRLELVAREVKVDVNFKDEISSLNDSLNREKDLVDDLEKEVNLFVDEEKVD